MTRGLILSEDNTSELKQIIDINIIGLCVVTREAVKQMKIRSPERKKIGHIINITSTVGQKIDSCVQTKPINGLYPAGKWVCFEKYHSDAFHVPSTDTQPKL